MRFKELYILKTFVICLISFQVHSQSNKQDKVGYKQQQTNITQIDKTQQKSLNNQKAQLSLFGLLSLNNQRIDDKGITTPVNYLYNSVNNNAFKPGYSGGFRWDGNLKHSNSYSLIFGVNRISAGNFYKNKYSIAPFPEEFTHFKADNNFTTINIAAHYRKLLPISKNDKYKFYAIVGPSFDYKILNISNENLINGAANRSIINGDFGAEFDNKGFYVLFAHYKRGMNLLNSNAPIQLNRFEIGMSIKAKDLF